MYRAITWHVLDRGIDPREPHAITAAVERARIDCDLITMNRAFSSTASILPRICAMCA